MSKMSCSKGVGYCVEKISIPINATACLDPVIIGFDGKRRKADAREDGYYLLLKDYCNDQCQITQKWSHHTRKGKKNMGDVCR